MERYVLNVGHTGSDSFRPHIVPIALLSYRKD